MADERTKIQLERELAKERRLRELADERARKLRELAEERATANPSPASVRAADERVTATPTPTPTTVAASPASVRAFESGDTITSTPTVSKVTSTESEPKRYYNPYTGEYVDDPSKIKPRTGMGGSESGGEPIQVAAQELPEGFTAGPFPKELEKLFGAPGDILGYRINTETDKDGKTYFTLSVAQKGAYGEGVTGFSTFGAPFTKDASGNYVGFSPNRGGTNATITGGTTTLPFTGTFSTTTLPYTGSTTTMGTTTTSATGLAGLTAERRGIFDVLSDRFSKYGLSSLVGKVRDLIINGATEDTITIQLQETPEYQRRFRANQDRIKKGLSVLTPAEYLNMEDAYRQILRSYGLNQFDTDDYVSQFISNDISAAELSNRVVNAVQRVRNADPAISQTLREFYGIGQNDLVAYVLDPNQQLPKIERQISAAEIGTAARRQGIQPGVAVAEQLAAQGVTQAEAQRGYATIADILPTAEKLSGIYGTTLDKYGLEEGEQEVFNTLASAQRKRQRLIGREAAEFSGQSGISRSALGTSTGGQY